ncbi:MAG: hypothetical protein JWO59_1785 [Chloroflexi bacterium]|nr:hypothetical protein [Chloroflexota bacterium]
MEPLRVIAAPHRLQILGMVWDKELSAGEIAAEFDVSWGAISQHLTVLKKAGFVTERRQGTSRFYTTDKASLGSLRVVVEEHWRDRLGRLKALAEAEQRERDLYVTVPKVLEVSVHIKARPETVFRYFTDPTRYAQWMGTDVTIEAVPGGTYRVRMRDGVETSGQFVEVDAPRRIVFTWGWIHDPALPPGSTRVELTLVEDADGTNLVLRHFGLPDAAQRDHHRKGWELYLHRLAVCVSGGDPGPDPNATA